MSNISVLRRSKVRYKKIKKITTHGKLSFETQNCYVFSDEYWNFKIEIKASMEYLVEQRDFAIGTITKHNNNNKEFK